jgi:hypothetical protein
MEMYLKSRKQLRVTSINAQNWPLKVQDPRNRSPPSSEFPHQKPHKAQRETVFLAEFPMTQFKDWSETQRKVCRFLDRGKLQVEFCLIGRTMWFDVW